MTIEKPTGKKYRVFAGSIVGATIMSVLGFQAGNHADGIILGLIFGALSFFPGWIGGKVTAALIFWKDEDFERAPRLDRWH